LVSFCVDFDSGFSEKGVTLERTSAKRSRTDCRNKVIMVLNFCRVMRDVDFEATVCQVSHFWKKNKGCES
jgi:hypothetical protein